ncbi:MAG TPA: hypothetical protein VKR58_04265 [Aquella sp.]|nr:hypothetical protein [Aquella sp.]
MESEKLVSLTEFKDFLKELNFIVNKLRETKGSFHPTEAVIIFNELGTTQEIKEKLLIFGQCLVEITRDLGVPDPRSIN